MMDKRKAAPTLYAIIALKLVKFIALLALAFGAYHLAGQDLHMEFSRFLRWLSLDPEGKFFTNIGNWLDTVSPGHIRWVALGSLLYSLFCALEGVGLCLRASWAGWLAIGESAFFIPIEVYDLTQRFSGVVFIILVLNVVIVWYLALNKSRLFQH